MLMFFLAISCLTMSNLSWFMDLIFQVPMQYCSLEYQTLLSPPGTSTTERPFCFGPASSFFLELLVIALHTWGFPGGTVGKNPPANAGDAWDASSIPGLERSPGEGNGNLLQYSCLENSMDRGTWQATVHRVSKSQAGLSNYTHTHFPGSIVDSLPTCRASSSHVLSFCLVILFMGFSKQEYWIGCHFLL